MTLQRIILAFALVVGVAVAAYLTLQFASDENSTQQRKNNLATATAVAYATLEKDEDDQAQLAVAEAIARNSLENPTAGSIEAAIVAASIANGVEASGGGPVGEYTRHALLQELANQNEQQLPLSDFTLADEDILSNNKEWLVTFKGKNQPYLWNLGNNSFDTQENNLLKVTGNTLWVDMNPNNKWLVVITDWVNGTPYLINLDKAREGDFSTIQLPSHGFGISDYAFSKDGKWFATGSRDKIVRLWDLETIKGGSLGESLTDLKKQDNPAQQGHAVAVTDIAFDPNNNWLASGDENGHVFLWNLKTTDPWRQPITMKKLDGAVVDIRFAHNASNAWFIVITRNVNQDERVHLWNINMNQVLKLACEKHDLSEEKIHDIAPDYPFDLVVCPD